MTLNPFKQRNIEPAECFKIYNSKVVLQKNNLNIFVFLKTRNSGKTQISSRPFLDKI